MRDIVLSFLKKRYEVSLRRYLLEYTLVFYQGFETEEDEEHFGVRFRRKNLDHDFVRTLLGFRDIGEEDIEPDDIVDVVWENGLIGTVYPYLKELDLKKEKFIFGFKNYKELLRFIQDTEAFKKNLKEIIKEFDDFLPKESFYEDLPRHIDGSFIHENVIRLEELLVGSLDEETRKRLGIVYRNWRKPKIFHLDTERRYR